MIKYILQLVLAVVLIYWGYQNLYPIEMIEYRFVEQYIGGWYAAPILARFLVGLNWFVAALLISNIRWKNIIPTLLVLLSTLHIYNLLWEALSNNVIIIENYTTIIEGYLWFSYPVIALMLLVAFLNCKKEDDSNFRFIWIRYPIGLGILTIPFILNAIFPNDLTDETEIWEMPFQSEVVNDPYFTDLIQDRTVVCFYSTSCPFCVRAAKKIAVAQKRYPYFPEVFVLFQGDEYGAKYFLEVAGLEFDYQVLSLGDYSKLNGLTFPRFQLVYDGYVERKWDGQTFDFSVMNALSKGIE